MIDRWTFIRRRAHEVLDRYAAKANNPAFQSVGGSHLVLRDIARLGFDEYFLDMDDDDLEPHVDGELSTLGQTISVRSGVEAVRKPFVAAHEMGHLALKHPARDFQCPTSQSADQSSTGSPPTNSEKGIYRDEAHHVEEQPNASELAQMDKVPRAYRPRDRWELEANVFAAELLAPLHEVRRYIREHTDWTLEDLTDYFGLSRDAMRNQLVSAYIVCPRPDFTENAQHVANKPVELASYLKLDDLQKDAAKAPAPALIIAGPGAGKTRVLTARFVRLVNEEKVEPHRILALTFSNKAVAEMRQRLYEAFPDIEHEVQVFTFHSLGLELLIGYGGYKDPPIILSDSDAFVFLRSRLHELPLGQFRSLTNPTLHLDVIHKRINRLKEEGITPEEFRSRVLKWQDELDANLESIAPEELAAQKETAIKCLDLAAMYSTYQRWLKEAGYVDYPDLINLTLRLFEGRKVAQSICDNYDHILVDEFQDINQACGQLVKALDDGQKRVWAVADPRQSIYGFRGASLRHLARFKEDYEEPTIIKLDTNYRSVAEIVAAGDAVPFPQVDGVDVFQVPKLIADRGPAKAGPAIRIGEAPSLWSEIAELVVNIRELSEDVPLENIAILCRDRYQARHICEALEEGGIPTNWSGQPEEQEAFKDLMAILLLANNRPLSLIRLAKRAEHSLNESDLKLILHEAAKPKSYLYKALNKARLGKIPGLSEAGKVSADVLRKLAGRLYECPNAWNALAVYLFEETTWIRTLLEDPNPRSRRYLATICQVLDLAREFAFKGKISYKADIAAFLDYVYSTRETGSLHCPDSTPVIADAVNILTIHKSKGLEWPVVFIPNWGFAPYSKQEPIPLPSHLLAQGTEEVLEEEAFGRSCLAYVAITRAENQLWISYSAANPYFLGEITESLGAQVETRQITRPNWTRKYPPLVKYPYEGHEIEYSMIRQYGYCPKRAHYDYSYELHTESSGYLFFVRQLRDALNWLIKLNDDGASAAPDEIDGHIETLWQKDSKPERRLSPFYKDQALKCAHAFASRLVPGTKVELLKSWQWPTGIKDGDEEVYISFKTDEFIAGSEETGEPALAFFHRYDSPSEKHLTDPLLALYLSIKQDENDNLVEVRLNYLSGTQEREVFFDPNNSIFVEETKIMIDRVKRIKNGFFPAKPKNSDACRRCPYNMICPT